MKYIIVAIDYKNGIGKDGVLPWSIKKDMNHFVKITSENENNVVIMGKHTWFSIPKKYRPLKDRKNIIISKTSISNQTTFDSIDKALNYCDNSKFNDIYFIGGSGIYKEIIERNLYDGIFITEIYKEFYCDTFFPIISSYNVLVKESNIEKENDTLFRFKYYKNTYSENKEESQYLSLIDNIIKNGSNKNDRTKTGTLSLFGTSMRFNLSNDTIPLLTTKRVFWRGVAEELLWFISGDTNAKSLKDKNIHIWDGNASREYMDSIGILHREENDLGPVYGFQWRHFGAKYKTMFDNYDNQGIDQLHNLIEQIKSNPNGRRHILSAWNPKDLSEMNLPPCHLMVQFYVQNKKLSCQMYQRSADVGLGVPFNIASYSLLTHLIAHCTGLEAGEFIHIMGDTHVYLNHVEPLKEQIKRKPTKFPKLKINTQNKNINNFKYEDFEIVGYKPQKSIKMEMSV